jgi:serine/threonine protein kinase
MAGATILLKVVIAAAAIVAGAVLAVWFLIKGTQGMIWGLNKLGRGIAFLVHHVFTFLRNTVVDALRSIGALLTACVLIPLAFLNLILFRWETSAHYARALEDEAISFGLGIYRLLLGNPLRLVGMGVITDGLERRVPDVVAHAPRNPESNVRDGKFEGYKVTGVLPAGGSGARLFLAKPRPKKLGEFLDAGHADPGLVVIKAFSLGTGSTLPQIVRESRALESARRLGLVLEHELTERSFHYVMPYVPGDGLDAVIAKMHERAGDEGLSDRQLRVALGYVGDLLYTLDAFHDGGLWHKDIKPSNVIISEGRAHLVDLGLVTPLASAMTLTTHGTEFYRDPEMVRQALRGVKVHEANGVKFDIYSTGAVLYSLIENSFPAHGSLSRFTHQSPEAINWIVRRAMADVDGRYGSAQEMLADIRTVLTAHDPYDVRPAQLPSVSGKSNWHIKHTRPGQGMGATGSSGAPESGSLAGSRGRKRRRRPVAHTATATKQVRRSVGRSLVAAFIGIFFLTGVLGMGILTMRLGATHPEDLRPFAPVEIAFADDPAGWCLENESTPSSLPEQTEAIPVPCEDEALAKVAQKQLVHLQHQWSHRLDRNLDQVADVVRGKAQAAGRDRESSGTILLVQDLRPTAGREILGALHAELDQREFDVVGNPPDGIGDERDILYEAGARAALGIADSEDPEALLRLELYLVENPNLDAMIWISEGGEENSVQYQFVQPRSEEVPLGTFALSSSSQ